MSIGTQLSQARKEQSLSLDQAAQATHIKLHYLEALEADQFEKLPSAVQLRGFLRAYGEYLKLNSRELIGALEKTVPEEPAASIPSAPTENKLVSPNSEAIFKELGHTLKSQRELMGLSLGDVERHTHIRMHYARALEEGDIAHLPSPVQGRGMLSNYASFLGLNSETVLLRFADGLQASLYDRQAARNTPGDKTRSSGKSSIPARPSQWKRFFSMDLFVGGFLILFLLGFTVWGAMRISRLHAGGEPSPTAPSVSEVLLASPTGEFLTALTDAAMPGQANAVGTINATEIITGTVNQVAAPSNATSEPTLGMQSAPVQVYVVGVQRAWVRITVDGEVAFEGRLMPGSAYMFDANERIELLTGDGGGLRVYYNQQDLGILGAFGEVVNRVFSTEGMQTATPAVPPTRTPLPTGTVTPTPSPTRTGVPATPTPTIKP